MLRIFALVLMDQWVLTCFESLITENLIKGMDHLPRKKSQGHSWNIMDLRLRVPARVRQEVKSKETLQSIERKKIAHIWWLQLFPEQGYPTLAESGIMQGAAFFCSEAGGGLGHRWCSVCPLHSQQLKKFCCPYVVHWWKTQLRKPFQKGI